MSDETEEGVNLRHQLQVITLGIGAGIKTAQLKIKRDT